MVKFLTSTVPVYNNIPESFLTRDKKESDQIISKVETDLYTAEVSSYNGGSIQSFILIFLKTNIPEEHKVK